MTRDAVTSDQLPASGLPFSVAVRGGVLLFLSGQVAQDPATGELVDGDIAQQADQILRNIAATLAAIGKDLDDVIRVGVYLTDMSQFGAMNEAYRRHFAEPYPARTAIGVPPCRWARRSRWMWWWAEVSAGGTRSSGTVIVAMRARHSARRPHRTGASACRTRAVTLLRQPDIVGREDVAHVPRDLSHCVTIAAVGTHVAQGTWAAGTPGAWLATRIRTPTRRCSSSLRFVVEPGRQANAGA